MTSGQGEHHANVGKRDELGRSPSDLRFGPVNSDESLATVPALSKAGTLNIIIGSLDELTSPAKYRLAFRTINTNTQWINAANHYALDTLKRHKVTPDRRHVRLRHLKRQGGRGAADRVGRDTGVFRAP